MGVVFRVHHAVTGEPRALKALSLAAEPHLLERFRREGLAQARVDRHPHVVRVHEAGSLPSVVYLVLDLVEGGDLATRLRERGPLPAEEAAALTLALARGLAHVHAKGVLHRDLKPANVLFDAAGTPKLADFGLARLRGEGALTATGELLGTPGYMAPEQVEGSRAIDERADVYGLGAVLYALLCGEAPFRGGSAIELIHKVLSEAPAPPRARRPEVPPALEAICLRALAKSPGDRQPSAEALAAELAAFLAGEAPRSRAVVGAAAGGLALVLLVLAAGWWATRPSPEPPSRAEAPADPIQRTVDFEPAAAEPPLWALAAGDTLGYRLQLSEQNSNAFKAEVVLELAGRVVARRPDGTAELSLELTCTRLWAGSVRSPLSSLLEAEIPPEALAGARGEVTLALDLATGTPSDLRGVEALHAEVQARLGRRPPPPDGGDQDFRDILARQRHDLVDQFFSSAVLQAMLAAAFQLRGQERPWRAISRSGDEEVHALELQREEVLCLVPWLSNHRPESLGERLRGSAVVARGRVVRVELEQTVLTDQGRPWTSRFVCEQLVPE